METFPKVSLDTEINQNNNIAFHSSSLLNEFSLCILTICVTILILMLLVFYYQIDFHFPLSYEKDGLLVSTLIKTIFDSGWYLQNNYLGAPGMYALYDYPLSDDFSISILKVFSLYCQNYIFVLNIFYFLTFLLAAATGTFAFRFFGINKTYSVLGGLIFSFLPYHFLRGESHLFLSAYYVVPFYFLIVWNILKLNKIKLPFGFQVMLMIIAGSSGIYYAFFGSFFILLAGIMQSLEEKKSRPLILAFTFICIIVFTIMVNVAPNIIARFQQGPNKEVAYRSPAEAEQNGLKIIQLLSPIDQHRLPGFRKSKEHYNKTAPLINENTSASLGMITSIGFIILILALLFKNISPRLFFLSRLNLFAVILGTVGGGGAIFAYHFSAMIRSYNRISIFIAFLSLSALLLILQNFFKTKKMFIACFLLVFSLLDQIPIYGFNQHYDFLKLNFKNDAQFNQLIENTLPTGANIFQLPYMSFPENPGMFSMDNGDPLRSYLHTKYLHWSYGAMKGRQVAIWQEKISKEPVSKMVTDLQNANFKGLFIDTYGFKDHAKNLQFNLDKLNLKNIKSNDHRFIFYYF